MSCAPGILPAVNALAASTGKPSALSRGALRWAITLLTVLNLLNYLDRFVMPAVIRAVTREIPMSDTRQGVILSAFIWVYMIASPLFGRMADRGKRKVLLACGVALWSLATGATSLAHSFLALLAARAAVGVGEAVYATVTPSLIGDYYPAEQRGRILAVFYLAIPVGSAIGYGLGGYLSARYGWRMSFLGVGLPGLVLALLALTIIEPQRGQFDEGAPEPLPLRASLEALFSNKLYRWTVAGGTAYTFALGGLAQWMPSYLQRVRHMSEARSSLIFGAITVLAGFVGTAVGGALAEALKPRRRDAYLWVSGASVLLAVPLALAVLRIESEGLLWGALFIVELLLFMCTGPFNTVLINCVSANNRAMAFALSIFVSHALGDAFSPTLIGMLSDATDLETAMVSVPVAFGLAAFFWLYIERSAPAPTPAP